MSTDLRILVTGSREWRDRDAIRQALTDTIDRWKAGGGGGYVTVVHGGARGADTIAGDIAHELRCVVEIFHADWECYGKRAGLVRNQLMVDQGADVCLAFPLDDSRGTRHCMEQARKAGIPVVVHEPVPECNCTGLSHWDACSKWVLPA